MLISIFGNDLTEEKAKKLCIDIGYALDIKSNYFTIFKKENLYGK